MMIDVTGNRFRNAVETSRGRRWLRDGILESKEVYGAIKMVARSS